MNQVASRISRVSSLPVADNAHSNVSALLAWRGSSKRIRAMTTPLPAHALTLGGYG